MHDIIGGAGSGRAALSIGAVLLVAVQDDAGAAASIVVLLMTVPVAYARRATSLSAGSAQHAGGPRR